MQKFSDNYNVQQLVSLLIEYGIKDVVLCPGSRNAPIIQTIIYSKFFNCHSVVDERSAGFYALGIALSSKKPVVVCCTSGTALVNLYSSVAESFYQKIPLIIISADRPKAWIGQMQGQTLVQENIFDGVIKYSCNLPIIKDKEDYWYANRLINEALLNLSYSSLGPIHINIPLAEPLFSFNTEELPKERLVKRVKSFPKDLTGQKVMLILGQNTYDSLEFKQDNNLIIISENLSNCPNSFKGFDTLLKKLTEKEKEDLSPDILITCGGHLVSKRIKKFMRTAKIKEHWHLWEDSGLVDLSMRLSVLLDMDRGTFIEALNSIVFNKDYFSFFQSQNKSINKELPENLSFEAVRKLILSLPSDSNLHLANSTALRYAELCEIRQGIKVYCNRGINGIDGCLSTAIGFSVKEKDRQNFLIIGDLSFFYDMNALSLLKNIKNLKILLINDGGGGIFNMVEGLDTQMSSISYIAAKKFISARDWVLTCGLTYFEVYGFSTLDKAIYNLINSKSSTLLELIIN